MNEREDALIELCRRFSIEIMYVFGSRAMEVKNWLENDSIGLSTSTSDVDFGVKSTRPLKVQEKVSLALALESLLGVVRVDLVSVPEVDPFLAANIIKGERLYAEDGYLADEYDLYILRRAGDLIPLERERMALLLGENL